jgi:hypothetical protein
VFVAVADDKLPVSVVLAVSVVEVSVGLDAAVSDGSACWEVVVLSALEESDVDVSLFSVVAGARDVVVVVCVFVTSVVLLSDLLKMRKLTDETDNGVFQS